MIRGIVLLLCLMPGLAAAESAGWEAEGVKSVEIAGAVDAPLVRAAGSGQARIAVTLPAEELKGKDAKSKPAPRAKTAFWAVGYADENLITSDYAEEIGAKISGKPGKAHKPQTATVAELSIAGLTLHDLRFRVVDDPKGTAAEGPGAYLALHTLAGVASAILPSEGVIRLVPADQGATLVSGLGGAASAGRYELDDIHWHGQRLFIGDSGPLVEGSFGGAQGKVQLSPASATTVVYSAAAGTALNAVGRQWVRGAASAQGLKLGEVHAAQLVWADGMAEGVIATLGADVLHSVDIAFDPSSGQVALKAAATAKWSDLKAAEAAHAKAELPLREADDAFKAPGSDEKPEAPATEGAEAPKGDKKAAARHSDTGKALWAAGENSAAIEQFKLAAAAAGEDCHPYFLLGKALVQNGEAAAASEPLAKSAELFGKWERQSQELKQQINEADDDKKKAELPEGAYTTKQDSACHKAPGYLAAVALTQGDHATVNAIYTAWLDLDRHLPHIQGISWWRQGKLAEAEGALRRSINLGGDDNFKTRIALGFVAHELGNDEAARGQIDALHARDLYPGFTASVLTAELLDHVDGRAKTVATLTERVAGNPLSVEAHVVLALALHRQGDTAAVAAAVKAAEPVLIASERARAGGASVAASRAVLEALSGRPDDAFKTLKLAAVSGPTGSDWYLAKAIVHSLKGDASGAMETLSDLQRRYPGVPLPNTWMLGPF